MTTVQSEVYVLKVIKKVAHIHPNNNQSGT